MTTILYIVIPLLIGAVVGLAVRFLSPAPAAGAADHRTRNAIRAGIIALIVAGLISATIGFGWLSGGSGATSSSTGGTATPYPTYIPYPTYTPVPTGTPVPTSMSAPTGVPTTAPTTVPTSAPTIMPTVGPSSTGCTKHGLAWHADNLPGTQVYGPSIIGGLQEPCWVVNQLWTNFGGTERWLVAVRPNSYIEIANHKGGSGWYFSGDDASALANLNEQAAQVLQRDGAMKTTIIIVPDQIAQFRLVTRWAQTSGVAPGATPTVSVPTMAGSCSGNTGIGPVIMEGDVGGKSTVVKVNSSKSYALAVPGGCFPFPSQSALDARWATHKAEFLAKYPAGQAIEP